MADLASSGEHRDPHAVGPAGLRQARPPRPGDRRRGRARRDHVDPRHHRRLGRAARPSRREFDATAAQVAWTMTGYTLALAAVIPMTGWAADRFGTKRLYLLAIVLFALGSVLCAAGHHVADAGHLPRAPGPRRRHADAARHDDPDPRRRAGADRPGDGRDGRPDAARPDLRPDPRRLPDRRRELALDLPDQHPDRHRRLVYAAIALPRTSRAVREPRLASACCCSRPASRSSSSASPRSPRPAPSSATKVARARRHRHPAHRRVRAVGPAPPQPPPADRPAALPQPQHDHRGDRHGALRDLVLRGQPALPALLPAGPRRGRPPRRPAAGAAGHRRDDHDADRRDPRRQDRSRQDRAGRHHRHHLGMAMFSTLTDTTSYPS